MRPLTRLCFLLFFLEWFPLVVLSFLLGIFLPSLWNPPFPPLAPTPIPLSLAKVRLLLILTFSNHTTLVIWTDNSVPFPFVKVALASLPTAHFVVLKQPFPFRQAQYVWFPLKPMPFCKLTAGSAAPTSLALLFPSLILALSLPLCPLLRLSLYLKLFGRSGRSCLLSPPLLSGYNGSPGTHFSRETKRLMSRLDGYRYSYPLQSLALFFALTARIHSCLLSDWRRTVSSKLFDT